MTANPAVDITELAVLGEQFPLRLMQLGFRLMQVMDESGRDQVRYVVPPICAVPTGPFLMGSNKKHDPEAQDDEVPQHIVQLPAYSIGTYPLTVAEYACFVQATQCAVPDAWIRQQRQADHPVVQVSWQDVLAYMQWLAQVTGEPWRLPTEAEWEKAARGTDGRIYPWGDEWDSTRANTWDRARANEDRGPLLTTPVGSYPSGASPSGVQDLAGNVNEWTSTTYQMYPYQAHDGREDLNPETDKVLRGGGWGGLSWHVRAAFRYSEPSYTDFEVGVRLVRGSVEG